MRIKLDENVTAKAAPPFDRWVTMWTPCWMKYLAEPVTTTSGRQRRMRVDSSSRRTWISPTFAGSRQAPITRVRNAVHPCFPLPQ